MKSCDVVVRGTEGAKRRVAGLGGVSSGRVAGLVGPLFLLGVWQILSTTGVLDARFFPSPLRISEIIVNNAQTGQLEHDLGVSLVRIVLGFVLGVVPGLLIGISMGLFPVVGAAFDPLIAALQPIPKLALMPLIMVLFGLGELEKVMVLLLGVFFPVVINAAAGVRNLDRAYLDVAQNFGASKFQYYRTVAIPGALSMIFTGLKLGIGMALLLIVAAEMHGALAGIGYRLWYAYTLFRIPTMYTSFVLLALLGWLFTTCIEWVERRMTPWKQAM